MAQNDFCRKLLEKRGAMFPVECGLSSALSKNADERFNRNLSSWLVVITRPVPDRLLPFSCLNRSGQRLSQRVVNLVVERAL
jgi:hypothetical protein